MTEHTAAALDVESPVDEYGKALEGFEACASRCRLHFAAVADADEVFRGQQQGLFGLLTSADSIWDDLLSARDGGNTQKKHAAKMHKAITSMSENLRMQDSSLTVVEEELAALATSIADYQKSIAEARAEHGHVKAAIEGRVKSMTKMLKSLGASGESRRKERPGSGERKDSGERRSKGSSPKTSVASPPRSASKTSKHSPRGSTK